MSSSRSGRSRPIAPGRRALSTVLASLLQAATTWRSGLTGQDQPALGTTTAPSRRRIVPRFIVATLVTALVALSLPMGMLPASAASVSAASFSGDSKSLVVDGQLYAKNKTGLTLNVTTAAAAKCVVVSGDHSATQTHAGKTSWSFGFTAGDGNGVKTVTAHAFDNQNCTNNIGTGKQTMTASYVLDNAGPDVSASLSPAANAAGWNKSPVSLTWNANDGGSGVDRVCTGSGSTHNPKPCIDSVTTATNGTSKTSDATDRLGNAGSGSVVVKIDTAVPTITGSRSPAQPSSGWNNTDVAVNFSCADPMQGAGSKDNPAFASGIKTCPESQTVTTDGANQSVTGKAVDVADNEATARVESINIDKTAPVVTGMPRASANGDGWYNGDVSIAWTCTDPLSGVNGTCPGDSTITGEGNSLGVTSPTVSDRAGNSGSGSVSGIKIDRTAPNTTTNATTNWNNQDVTVILTPSDSLSQVKSTHYKLNGGDEQTGTSIPISTDGVYTLEYWSVDKAGNVEPAKSVQVKIDKTKPSINHTQDPVANDNGWNNTNVTVTFTCDDDGGSGIASCTDPVEVTTEGENQPATGTAVDSAGNTATDPATVSIDKTVPTIDAVADRDANANGWYKNDVTVSFTCEDRLSGISVCPLPQTLGEGGGQSASGTATDAADNSASATKGGINVDKTAPTLTGAAQGSPAAGWYNGDVIVKWTCSDEGGSGIDGDCPTNSTVTGEGQDRGTSASVSDKAGNRTNANVAGINIDRTAPTTEAKVPPATNGWHPGSVEVALAASDNLSQVEATYYSLNGGEDQRYTGPIALITTRTHSITFWSVDKAGNVEDKEANSNTITVQVDNTKPSIVGSVSSGTVGSNGWYVTAPIVSFSCDDPDGSGIEACLAEGESTNSKALTEGANQSVSGTATDLVGNIAQASVTGINVDLSNPYDITFVDGPDTGVTYPAGQVPAKPSCTAKDDISGFDSCTVTGYKTEAGTHTMTATAVDKAGREASTQRTYTVAAAASWTASGYYRPIEMSAKDSAPILNTAKNGSTIPFKFEVFAGPGETNEVTDSSKIAMSVQTISCSTGGIEDPVDVLASGSTNLRYDTTGGQFVYNWKTPTRANTCYKVIMTTTEGGAVIDNAFIRLK